MSDAEMSPEPETIFVFQVNEADVLDLLRGYVNLKVRGMCALCCVNDTVRDQARADRPYRPRKNRSRGARGLARGESSELVPQGRTE